MASKKISLLKFFIYNGFLIFLLVFCYVGYLGIQQQSYLYYSAKLVEALLQFEKIDRELKFYPSVQSLSREVFEVQQKEHLLKMVNGLLLVNHQLALGGEFKKTLEKYKTQSAGNYEADFYLIRELQVNLKLLPPPKWNIPVRMYLFAVPAVSISSEALKNLAKLKLVFSQKMFPLEKLIKPNRPQTVISN